MTLDDAIASMMTCAIAHVCAREEACFAVVKWAREQLAENRARADFLLEVEADDEVAHYAPNFPPIDWEMARPDWSAT